MEKAPVQYERRTELDFGERAVFSTIRSPLGWYELAAGPAQRWTPLVRLRANFDAEMVRSADEVR